MWVVSNLKITFLLVFEFHGIHDGFFEEESAFVNSLPISYNNIRNEFGFIDGFPVLFLYPSKVQR